MEDIVTITPDKERAKSLMDMTLVRLESIDLMKSKDIDKFSSKIAEEFYEVLLEMITAIMCLDGYKIRSDALGAHKIAIGYMRKYSEITQYDLHLSDNLRQMRNGVKYYGRHIDSIYILQKESDIRSLIGKLKSLAEKRFEE